MKLFALLAACICIGLSSGQNVHVHYGQRHSFKVPVSAEYLYFETQHYSISKLCLWVRSKPSNTLRGEFDGRRFLIENLTQEDHGMYTLQTRSYLTLANFNLYVSRNEQTFSHAVGEGLHFEFPLDPKLCTITFTPFDGDGSIIVRRGFVVGSHFSWRLKVHELPIISVDIQDLQVEDSGVFEIIDNRKNVAMQVNLEVAASALAWVNAGWAAGLVSVVVSCCCCLKRCCCKKSSKSSEEVTQPEENPPDLQQYSAEPRPPSYHREPIPPVNVGHEYAYHPADPGPSTVEMYSPASVPFTAPLAQEVPLASNFLSSETDPCFEMKDMPPPLYSECVSADVYTSDKLNFSFL